MEIAESPIKTPNLSSPTSDRDAPRQIGVLRVAIRGGCQGRDKCQTPTSHYCLEKREEHAARQPQVVEAVSAGGQDGWRSVGD